MQWCWNIRFKVSVGFDFMFDILVILEMVGIIIKGFYLFGLGWKDLGLMIFDWG